MSEIPSQGPGTAAGLNGDKRIAHTGEKEKDEEESRWRLDRLPEKDAGPVLSPDGKVLRPFTILPSTSSTDALSTRLRLQSEIFRPSHRLPTMTIDEFLEQEQERGNVLQGGGPKTSDEVEQARKDEAAEEGEDDTAAGYAREEAGLRKKREWDDYTDQHRKGEGNMCVRPPLSLSLSPLLLTPFACHPQDEPRVRHSLLRGTLHGSAIEPTAISCKMSDSPFPHSRLALPRLLDRCCALLLLQKPRPAEQREHRSSLPGDPRSEESWETSAGLRRSCSSSLASSVAGLALHTRRDHQLGLHTAL